MPNRVRRRCNNCGHRFEAEVLTDRERRDARDEGIPLGPIRCPKCQRADTRNGWE